MEHRLSGTDEKQWSASEAQAWLPVERPGMVATLKKPWMNKRKVRKPRSSGAFLVHFWAVKKNTGLSEITFIIFKNLIY
jgi:hypothetical protein